MRTRGRRWFLAGPQGWSPGLYEAFFARTRWGRSLRTAEQDAIKAALSPYLKAGSAALEIGPGTGAYTGWLASRCSRVDAREPSPSMRGYLRRRALRENWPGVKIADGALPYDLRLNRTYDAVLAVGVLNYVPDLAAALSAIAHSVGPAGVVVINVPTAARAAGVRYELIELLGRRRIYRRNPADVAHAAQHAGLRIDLGPLRAGVTDVYRLRGQPHEADPDPE